MGFLHPYRSGNSGGSGQWQRNPLWLKMPAIGPAERVVCMLVSIPENELTSIVFSVGTDVTVDFGDGNIINYAPGDYTHIMDYSGASTILEGSTKQAIVTFRPQTDVAFREFVLLEKKPQVFPWANVNNHILEIHLGLMEITTSYGFRLTNLSRCESIEFKIPFVCNQNLTNVFNNNFVLANLKGYFESNIYNPYMLSNTFRLKNLDGFDFVCDGSTCSYMLNNAGFEEVYLPNFVIGSARAFLSYCRAEKATLNFTGINYGYQFAYGASALEELILIGDGSTCPNFHQAFNRCNFEETPAINMINCTSANGMFSYNPRLKKVNLFNLKCGIGFYDCNMTHSDIERFFNNALLTVTDSPAIDLRLNPDVENLPLSIQNIATNKGWTLLLV